MKSIYSPHHSINSITICLNNETNFFYITSSNKDAKMFEKNASFFFKQSKIINIFADEKTRNNPQNIALRAQALNLIQKNPSNLIIISDFESLITKTFSPDTLKEGFIEIKTGSIIDVEQIKKLLISNGYNPCSIASQPSEFAIRGGIIDIVFSDLGYRIDLMDETVETIKIFDPAIQISNSAVDHITIPPCTENITKTEENIEFLQKKIKSNFYIFDYVTEKMSFYFDREYTYSEELNDFFNKNKNNKTFVIGPNYEHTKQEQQILKIKNNLSHYILNSSRSIAESLKQIIYCDNIDFSLNDLNHSNNKTSYTTMIASTSEHSMKSIIKLMEDVGVNCKTIKSWEDIKKEKNHNTLFFGLIQIDVNCTINDILIINETDIFGNNYRAITTNKKKALIFSKQINYFIPGEFVVHKEYGIGKFLGLQSVTVQDIAQDLLVLEYANNEKLFLPVENINLLVKYGDVSEDLALDKLGGVAWKKRKAKAKEHILAIAEKLIKIAALRKLGQGEIFEYDRDLYDKFCSSFKYIETDDQLQAIQDVIKDLSSGIPMDRLICGDAGFGKTEVAIRASFIVAHGKEFQVAVLVPTKILSEQHLNTFKERFNGTGLVIRSLSGLQSNKENKQVIEMLKNGTINIVIGTHSLFSSNIEFANIGLFIIDEEHRFGVKQKEIIKERYPYIHILSMSATPIPRTLQMSLMGIKDLSILSTAPIDRSPISIYVKTQKESNIIDAILFELNRNGSIFYICPHIKDINKIIEMVENISKKIHLKINYRILHSKLQIKEIEKTLFDFYNNRSNLLISTPIIEVGIDIPMANTIIVYNADHFGLSQLYQFRGRVGRSNKSGHVYFTVPENKITNTEKMQRINIIKSLEKLNLGFNIATYDMDNRGFGNLVGSEQSGHIKEIGAGLYQEMLISAIEKTKNNNNNSDNSFGEKISTQIKINLSIKIPENYISESSLRLNFYQRLINADTKESLQEIKKEIRDRFGKLPLSVENLIKINLLKMDAEKHNISKIVIEDKNIIYFTFEKYEDPKKLIDLIQKNNNKIRLHSNNTILFLEKYSNPTDGLGVVEIFFRFLEEM